MSKFSKYLAAFGISVAMLVSGFLPMVQAYADPADPEPGQNEPGDPENPEEGGIPATIRLRGGEGSYEDGSHTVHYSDFRSYGDTSISLDSIHFIQAQEFDQVENEDYSEFEYFYDGDEAAETVNVTVQTYWHEYFLGDIVINNVAYPVADYIDYENRESYLNHYEGQVLGFTIEGVARPANDFYDIVVKVGKLEHPFIGNFLWTADPDQEFLKDCHEGESGEDVCEFILDADGNKIPGPDYIGHSTLRLIAAEYTVGNTTYSCNTDGMLCSWWTEEDKSDLVSCNPFDEDCEIPYIEFDSGSLAFDDGSLVVPEGARITMRIRPGLRLSSFRRQYVRTHD